MVSFGYSKGEPLIIESSGSPLLYVFLEEGMLFFGTSLVIID